MKETCYIDASKNKFEYFDTQEEIKHLKNNEDEKRKKSLEKKDSEVEKTEYDIFFIDLWISEINNILADIGLSKKVFSEEEKEEIYKKIHFIDKTYGEFYKKKEKDIAFGNYSLGTDDIKVFKSDEEFFNVNEKRKNFLKYKTLIHELIHFFAKNKTTYVAKNINVSVGQKSGLSFYKKKFNGEEDENKRLEWLNEAITESMAYEIFNKNSDTIMDYTGITWDNRESIVSYVDEIKKMDEIIDNISQEYNIDREEVWKEIKKAYFKGDMESLISILRKMKKTLGNEYKKVMYE